MYLRCQQAEGTHAHGKGNHVELGDVLLVRNKFLYTAAGVSTTHIWLDRNWTSVTTCGTVLVNPREYTKYLSFYYVPDTAEDIVIDGYIHPQDMVADSDICIFPANLVWVIIVGALLRDKFGREMVTDQCWRITRRPRKRSCPIGTLNYLMNSVHRLDG